MTFSSQNIQKNLGCSIRHVGNRKVVLALHHEIITSTVQVEPLILHLRHLSTRLK